MAFPSNPTLPLSFGIAVLIAWRVYRRVRRMIGRQKLSNIRPWITVSLYPALIALLLLGSIRHPNSALALMAGVGVGAGLGVLGLRPTQFEATPAGLFYTSNAHLGIALSFLFLGRVAYRAALIYVPGAVDAAPPADFARSPLTLLIFGTLAGYCVAYAIGLLLWRNRAGVGDAPSISAPPGG